MKATTRFICRSCGSVQAKWAGKCGDCGQWNSLEEHRAAPGADDDAPRGGSAEVALAAPKALPISAIDDTDAAGVALTRMSTGIEEFDRVLGVEQAESGNGAPPRRGIVPGSAVLLGGDPGIGKSTLLLQAAAHLAQRGTRVLYVTSEESAYQLRLRARRVHDDRKPADELFVLADTNLARITEQIRQTGPRVVIVDSIQMIYKGDLPAAPGSVTQLRSCCLELVYLAKASGFAVVFVGHVTKEGRLAGPRLLEHMVDTVLYFEGDRYHSHRIVRAIKNRFGTTLEVGLFEMTGAGLEQVADGAGLLAAEYRPSPGSVVCPVLQGSRCLLVEIQALTSTGFLGGAKRKTSGIDANRLAMLIAVLEKHGGLRLADQDIFTSSVGGMKIAEPAADLAIALAIAGVHYNRQLEAGVCAVGEIGLGGEIRHAQQVEQRLREAARLGFTHIICPKTRVAAPKGCTLLPVNRLSNAIELLA